MPEIERSRTIPEGEVTKGGFFVDLSSKNFFNPTLFDEEIKKVGTHTLLPDRTSGERVQAKFIVMSDKLLVFSAEEQHLDGMYLILRVFQDKDFSGKIHCAGHINVDFRKGS